MSAASRILTIFAAFALVAFVVVRCTGEPPGNPPLCIDNPRIDPDNDKNGPRATESASDATPYAGTPGAAVSTVCR
ncbi:hypothetical protein [Gloeobacter morelensis]|uniref:Secreted protein n=1 Tax=Gloeobacter morelensis MG652769 TaxID=2781736 RepID=A0ABY3PTP2_9CYAN|nr:hypothetical protein [Gloeobacter morelensis]UFP97115.1 hypothetical protein ISF26_11280 [Gloeobacter morelensis MG652769]